MLRMDWTTGGVAALGFPPPWSAAALALLIAVFSLLSSGCGEAPPDDHTSGDGVAPFVEAISPAHGRTDVQRTEPIRVTFSEPMEPVSTEAAVSLWPVVAGSFSWDETGAVLTLAPDALLPDDSEFTLTVAGTATDASGLTLREEASAFFYVVQDYPPLVDSTVPESGEDFVAVNFRPSMVFTEPMDPVTTAAALVITPPVAGTITFDQGGTRLVFTPDTQFAAFTSYGFTLGTGATDLTGTPLSAPSSFGFTTDDHTVVY